MQYVALLFDTYGEIIHSVELEMEPETSRRREVFINNYVRINHETCRDKDCDLGDEASEAIEQIDGSRVLWAVVDALNDIASSQLLSKLGLLQDAFEGAFRSAEQAREAGRVHGMEVAVHLEGEVLAQFTQPARGKGPGKRL